MPTGHKISDCIKGNDTYRICVICGEELLLDKTNFEINKKQTGGFRSECRRCRSLIIKEYPSRQPDVLAEKRRRYKIKNREKIRECNKKRYNRIKTDRNFIEKRNKKAQDRTAYLKDMWTTEIRKRGMDFCFYCGFKECFNAIDFHHVTPTDKGQEIARLFIRKMTPERLAELEKCIPLCATHHRMLHAGYITIKEIMEKHENM